MTPAFEVSPDLLAAGLRPRQIAEQLGVSVFRVYRALKRQGVAIDRSWRKTQVVAALANGARTARDLAQALGISERLAAVHLSQCRAGGRIKRDGFVRRLGVHKPACRWRLKGAPT